MYDPDSARPTLRLATIREAKDRHEERADIRRQIEALLVRDCELAMEIDADRAQARPIPISLRGLDGVNGGRGIEGCDGLQGVPGVRLTDNDFWGQRHRVMGGSQPLVARTTGMMTPLVRAAATGEIRDPVEALRTRERP